MKRNNKKSQDKIIEEIFKKMQKYLEKKKIASSQIKLERNTRIEIVGMAENGKERLIVPELREKYGSDNLELSDGFQILMPFISKGTIVIEESKSLKHYEEYEVYNVSDTKFSVKINDYIKRGKIYVLMVQIDVKDITRITPISTYSYKFKNVNDFFLKPYKESIDINYTRFEKDVIKTLIPNESEDYIISTICNVIAIFRAMNYLKDMYTISNSPSKLYANEYFKITNWNGQIEKSNPSDIKEIQREELLEKLMSDKEYSTIIPKNQMVFIIKELIKRCNIDVFLIAVGFVYESGIKIIEDELKMIAERENSDIEMIIGSLQYFDCNTTGTKIDKSTVIKINELIEKLDVSVYTYQQSFYHGKYYYLQNKNKAYVIIGSSNISSSAFNNNYEVDIIYTFNAKPNNRFINWFFQLRNESKIITKIDEQKFMESRWESEQDAFSNMNKSSISLESIKNQIYHLTDEDIKFRLNLWMNHMPTRIYNAIGIPALKNYIIFIFEFKHLAVCESFVPGNAYYVFRYDEVNQLFEDLSTMTKSQMRLAEYSVQRGNHIQNRDNLKRKIDKLLD